MQFWCQIVLIFLFACGSLSNIYVAFNGTKAKEPSGFPGFIQALVSGVLVITVWAGAGTLSEVVRWFQGH